MVRATAVSIGHGSQSSKYGNRKVVFEGQTFDSVHEAHRWIELRYLERAGMITDLSRQVPFELIPKQMEGKKVAERACLYIADFTYRQNGKLIVEDAKGFRTEVYRIKKKLMRYVHGIEIKEV